MPYVGPSEKREVGRKPDRPFVTGPQDGQANQVSKPALPGLRGVASQFRREDLLNPKRLDDIVSKSVDELIEVEFQPAAQLSPADHKHLAEWIGNDPILRAKIVKYLERVLE